MQANVLAGNRAAEEEWLLLDVIPLSLGIETMGGLVEKIIPRNSTIPTARAQDFTTFKDGQTAMSFHVVQGERELVADAARWRVSNCAAFRRWLPVLRASASPSRWTPTACLSVSAREQTTGVEARVEVKPSYGLATTKSPTCSRPVSSTPAEDMELRGLREQQVEAERVVEATERALAMRRRAARRSRARAPSTRPSPHCASAAEGQDARAIKIQLEAFNRASNEFASRRMDKSIREALAGHKIDEIRI
jgi:molecular chaperone HscA